MLLLALIIAAPCDISFTTRVEKVRVLAVAKNHTAKAQTIALPSRCPGGPIPFTGLNGHDFYDTCAAQPCHDDKPPAQQIVIPAGKEVVLASVEIKPNGGPCNGPLAAGSYEVSFSPPTIAQRSCGAPKPASFVHAPPAPKPCIHVPCGLGACRFGYAHDENGCSLCACAPSPLDQLRAPPSKSSKKAPN